VRYTRDVGPGSGVDPTGLRVSLRRRLAEGGLGDLLGVVESWSDGLVRLRDRHGALHEVAEGDVVAVKRIPPPPERR
jgi:hypothetical protein